MTDAQLFVCGGVVSIIVAHAALGRAAEYGGDTAADSDDELAALAAAGELDAETLDALQALHDNPPDPRSAAVEELALLPGVTRAQARASKRLRTGADAVEAPSLRFDAQALQHGDRPTQGAARLRLSPAAWWSASALLLARERTRLTAEDGRLVSDGPRRELGLERWHASLELGPLRVLIGSFNCAFGESLTFSSARHLYARTLAAADDIVRDADARSLRAAPALRGVALQLDLGTLEATVFASYRGVDLYQYGEWTRDGASPVILERGSGEALRYATIASAARETLAGGNIDARFGEQLVGVTAYVGGARLIDADGAWSASSIYPERRAFGAFGAHAITQLGPLRARLEGASTLAGGVGAVARVDLALGEDCDVSLAARHYGVNFDNPLGRSVAEPDVWEGARARNERGLEASTAVAVGGFLRLAASLDMWSAPTSPTTWNARARGRTSWTPTNRESVVLEGECVDKDVRYSGIYAGTSCAAGDLECARGARATGTIRVVTERIWRTRLALALRHARQDAARGVAQESRVTGHLTVRPWAGATLAVVASERVSPRAIEIDGMKRLVAVTAGFTLRWGSIDMMFRNETRWDGAMDAERPVNSGALTLTIEL